MPDPINPNNATPEPLNPVLAAVVNAAPVAAPAAVIASTATITVTPGQSVATYTIGQAPATANFRVAGANWFDKILWGFGDAGVVGTDPRNKQLVSTANQCEGASIAHEFTQPGTYTVVGHVYCYADTTGTQVIRVDTVTARIIVAPDARRHVNVGCHADIDALHLDTASNLYVTLMADIAGWYGVAGGSNVVIDLNGHTLSSTGGGSVCLAVRGTNISVRNGTIDKAGFAIAHYGTNLSLVNVKFGSGIGDAVKFSSGNGLLMQNCTAGLLGGRLLFIELGATNATMLFCHCDGSITESPVRSTAGGINGLTMLWCDLSQQDNGKAVITLRSASNCVLAYNKFTGGEVSFRTIDTNVVCRTLAKWNQLVSGKNEAFYRIAGNNTDICIRNTEVTCRNVAAVELSPSDGQAGPTTTDRITLFAVTRIAPSANRPVVRRQAATAQNTLGVVNETGSVQKIK